MPSLNRRTLLAAGLAATAVPAVAACGGSSSASPDGPIQFMLSGDANQGGGYAAMAEKYQEETGVEIEIVDVPYDDLQTKVRNASKANDLPAIGRMPSIDPVWLDRTVDLAEIAAEVKPIEGMFATDEDGKVPALPSDLTAVGMFLNKDLWDEAGVEYPTSLDDNVWTWDEFLDAANSVREATGIRFSLTMDRSSHRLDSFLYQNGSEGLPLNEDLTEYEANEATVDALERFIAMNDDEVMPRSVWPSNGRTAMKRPPSRSARSMVWPMTAASIRASTPSGTSRRSSAGASGPRGMNASAPISRARFS